MAGGVVNVRAQAVVKVQSPRGESEGRQGSSSRGSSVRGGVRGEGSREEWDPGEDNEMTGEVPGHEETKREESWEGKKRGLVIMRVQKFCEARDGSYNTDHDRQRSSV